MKSLATPVKRVKRPKLAGGRTRRLMKSKGDEDGEEERLLAACSDKFRAVIQFAIVTAMRKAEIALVLEVPLKD